MKLLIVGISDIADTDLSYYCYSTSYNFTKAIRNISGIDCEVDEPVLLHTLAHNPYRKKTESLMRREAPYREYDVIGHLQQLPDNEYDHIIFTGLRSLSELSRDYSVVSILKQKMRNGGALCEFTDVTIPKDSEYALSTDVAFVAIDDGNPYHVGWAADPTVFAPKQNDVLTIFVDHPHYGEGGFAANDRTSLILEQLHQLQTTPQLWNDRFSSIVIKRLSNSGLELVTPEIASVVECYNDNALPYFEYAAEMNTSHLFIPTHRESLGLSVLEAGMSGALVLSNPRFIPDDRLQTVHHMLLDFRHHVDWSTVVREIDPTKTRSVAIQNSWAALAENVVDKLRQYDVG